MKKKMISAVLALVMLGSLTACGSTGKEEDAATDGAKADEPVKLKILTEFDPQTLGEEYLATFDEVADELGYEIDVERVDTETYKTKIRVALQGNELPDVFFTWGDSYTQPFLDADALYPIDDALQEFDAKLYPTYAVPYEDGHMYTVPHQANGTYMTFYNKKVFEKLGMDVPTNWDELLAVVDKCNEQGIYALGLGNKDRWEGDLFYNEMVLREDTDAYNRAMDGDGAFTDEAFKNAAEKVETLVQKGAFQKGYMQATTSEVIEMFRADQIAMYPVGSWMLSTMIAGDLAEKTGYMMFPATGAAEEVETATTCMSGNLPQGLVASASSQFPEEAARFIVRYGQKINDINVKKGNIGFMETDVKPEGEVHEILKQYEEDFKNYKIMETWWFSLVDAKIGEPMRDLSHQQFAGQIEVDDFLKELNTIMKQ